MRYTVTSLAEIASAFAGFATYLEERAAHAPQQREREILRARAGTWREAGRVVAATTLEPGPVAGEQRDSLLLAPIRAG